VVTGLGIVSPIGNAVEEAWANAIAGTSGITRITKFDPSRLASQIAGEVKGFDVAPYMTPKEARRMDTFIHYGMAAGLQAWRDAKLQATTENAERIGINFGSGIGGLPLIEAMKEELDANGPRRISPFFIPGRIINLASGYVSIEFGLKGPNHAVTTACSTGAHAIGDAGRLVALGDADVMVAGGTESPVNRLSIAGFAAVRALSTGFNDTPPRASRPYDRDRDGFVMGEGAGMVVLEEYEHARRRGARIYAELIGYGLSGDAYHITAPAPDGDGALRCMAAAMRRANITAGDIDYINAHGTSTPLGDAAETRVMKLALGEENARKTPISSTKGSTGHCLGGAGAVGAIFSTLAIQRGTLPPTINYEVPDPECDLDYIPNEARPADVRVAISNSFGFGGHNSSIVLKRYED
jgi:3-oxoacyl-[acyl-carrier-protein] synthase II